MSRKNRLRSEQAEGKVIKHIQNELLLILIVPGPVRRLHILMTRVNAKHIFKYYSDNKGQIIITVFLEITLHGYMVSKTMTPLHCLTSQMRIYCKDILGLKSIF